MLTPLPALSERAKVHKELSVIQSPTPSAALSAAPARPSAATTSRSTHSSAARRRTGSAIIVGTTARTL